ncbi:MAG TPA: hypothetical protein VGW33_03405 [Terriglobia bacterium]|nr:hypothetical protein [Terriglobia bacterium]
MALRWQRQRRLWGITLLALAGLQAWVAYQAFSKHPYLAVANAAMALILILGVALAW